ncbi:MAG: GGDEF domain-containing protein, partial [Clostridia bacterium]|nr:GGDEF domain-containing protein [Clostridia bacterium]
YAGFRSEMVGYDNVPDMEEALREGRVDVLIDFVKTDLREEEFSFTQNHILEEQVSVYTRNTPDAPEAKTAEELEQLTIGMVQDAGYLDYFMDFCADEGIEPMLVPFRDELSMIDAMEKGLTDACLTGSAVPVGYRVLMSTPPIDSYLMLRKEDTQLLSRIDRAINQLRTDDPNYMSDLFDQYIGSYNTEMAPLTQEERAFLQSHPELSVALVRGAEPFTVEKEDGVIGGVIPDYYRAIAERLGVSFRFVIYDTTQEAISAVKGGENDILGHYYGDIILAERDELYDTLEYGSTECARLVLSSFTGTVNTTAVTPRTAYLLADQLDRSLTLVPYANVEEAYQALRRGEVDSMVGSMTAITWLINQHTMRGVSLSILPNVSLGVRAAVSQDNQVLMFALNKAIAVFGAYMNEAIIENAVNGKVDLMTALENLPLSFTAGVVITLSVLVIMLIISLLLLRKSSQTRIALLSSEMNVDSLTGAASRRYGTVRLGKELEIFRRYGDGPMLAMFDIDHFKEKNDTYGHEYGDFVLKRVVQVLRATLRRSDEIIRWGGDEFILLFPRTHGTATAERILEKVVRAVDTADFHMGLKGEHVSVSVGAAFFDPNDEDITEILRRSDIALYEAKKARNTYRIYETENT